MFQIRNSRFVYQPHAERSIGCCNCVSLIQILNLKKVAKNKIFRFYFLLDDFCIVDKKRGTKIGIALKNA